MNKNMYLILRREYLERVRRKSFIFTTILTPVVMLALMVLPGVVAYLSGPEDKSVAVVDHSAVIAPALQSNDNMRFVASSESVDKLRDNENYDAILVIGKDIVDRPDDVTFYTRGASSPQTEMYVSQMLSKIIEQHRLARYDIPDLPQILAQTQVNVQMSTVRIDREKDEATSSAASAMMGMLMSLVLYMFVLIYGQMVMTSIIEEKNNRVLEVVVSSVRPTELMLGKILGIGAVALTQIVIWAALISSFSMWVMPSLMSQFVTAGSDVDLVAGLSMMGNTGYVLTMFGLMTVLMVGGYLFYSALYAAIGSAVDNLQDASQLQTIAVMPIIIGLVFAMTVINDPNSTLAVVLSYIPFTSPMVMMARVPFGIPGWETALSIAVLYASVLFVVWLAAKIYRVGIFMYGKKPSYRELLRWARYK